MSELPTFEEKTPKETEYEQRIAASDARLGIEEFPIEDTTRTYYIRRTNGAVERWFHVGQGPDKGKFMSLDGRGVKYLNTETVMADQAALSMEYMIERAKAVTEMGAEATEAVPVIGPSQEIITGVPDFAKPPTQEVVATAFARPVESAEKVVQGKYDYLHELLPPVIRPEGRSSRYEASATVEDKQRNYYDRFVTPENREEARLTLVEAAKATPELREVLARFDLSPSSTDAVDAIRENAKVRFEVAKLLAEKLDRLVDDPYNDMGSRINRNSPGNLKVDPITGKRMQSRVYAIDMALKMIGGEFASRLEGKDDLQRGSNGSVEMGQHRHAARTTLMSYY